MEEGDPLEIKIDEQTIAKLKEIAVWALDAIKTEMKAQRLADAHGAIGWKTVKGIFVSGVYKLVDFFNCLV